MALNDIFTMIKADKYTQDGREELIKAQQAETEDKTYKPGEISERTGKQKQPDGSWKFPKQPGAKRDTDPQTYIVIKNDELRSMFQKEKDPAKKAAMKKALQKQASMMESEPFAPEEEAESKPAEFKIQGMTKEQYIPWAMEAYKIPEREAKSKWAHGEELHKNKMKEKEYDGIPSYDDFDPLRDSAPRVLTGDCKIRIRK